ncbi:hypothetical protein ACFQ0Q_10010 [Streptomyces aureus]
MTTTAITAPPPEKAPARSRAGGGLWRAVRGNRKAMAGAVILLVFTVVAAFPGLFTSVDHPDEANFAPASPRPPPTSSAPRRSARTSTPNSSTEHGSRSSSPSSPAPSPPSCP